MAIKYMVDEFVKHLAQNNEVGSSGEYFFTFKELVLYTRVIHKALLNEHCILIDKGFSDEMD